MHPIVNLACFLLTVYSTLIAGAVLAIEDASWPTVRDLLVTPNFWLFGWPYAACILMILGCHEMGHYVACRLYGIDATLPFFIPAPHLFGTFGAVIRIRAPITDRRALFDIGVAGPIAGFVVAVPVLLFALAHSPVVSQPPSGEGISFPSCLLLEIVGRSLYPALVDPDRTVMVHPTYWAAWLGLLATGLNLLPIGQLDGGHILYAVSGRWHTTVSRFGIPIMIAVGVWRGAYHLVTFAVLFAIVGYRHPPLLDERTPLGPGRQAIAWLALVIFLLTIMVDGIGVS